MDDRNAFLSPRQRETTLAYLETFQGLDGEVDRFRPAMLATFARCCLLLNGIGEGEGRAAPAQAGIEAEAFARSVLDHPDAERLELDPLVLLTHHLALQDAGQESAGLKLLLAKIHLQLRGLPKDIQRLGRVRRTAQLLRRAGFEAKVEPVADSFWEAMEQPQQLLTMSSDALQDLVDHIAVEELAIDPVRSEILALIALSELRNYRIDYASHVLRLLLSSANPRGCSDYIEEAINFIAVQRGRNGSYGFIEPFREDEFAGLDRDRNFHLPFTLNAVWLLQVQAQAQAQARRVRPDIGGSP
ncbi:MAG TPA: hypothetical protein VGM81_20820 [Burkholderiaceae bacterium]